MRTLTELIRQCALETDRFFNGQSFDSQYCFELFRKAILEHDPLAWEAVYTQYHPLVGKWVVQHPGFETSGEELQYFVNRAFEKLWAALAPEKFRGFTELGSLLRYLKMCVHSVISDYRRSLEQSELVDLSEEESGEIEDGAPPVEESALERAGQLAFWEMINARLNDEKERQVVYGSFVLALKPRELYEQFPRLFGNVDEVYLVKQNVLSRLRRDLGLAKFIGIHD
jgi:DNA-directed RNA polymerase specialized sigma24 family protein